MLSVLIPCYNWDVSDLIKDVLLSADKLSSDVEIIVCDDHTPDESIYQRMRDQFDQQAKVTILRNEQNRGRSKTRNRMVGMAKGEALVFIDGDSRLSNPATYLPNYVDTLDNHDIVVGGTEYERVCPSRAVQLHWNYGRNRESKSATVRIQAPLRYFFTNNFACRKAVFDKVKFDEEITTYGYEDSKWAKEVVQLGYSIQQIDNCVIHIGLKTTEKFLSDAQAAVRTLSEFYEHDEASNVKLLQVYRSWEGHWIGRFLLNRMAALNTVCYRILLHGYTKRLFVFDVYRMGLLRQFRCASEKSRNRI